MRTEPNEATFRTVKSADTRPDKSSAIRERSRRVQSNQAPKISSNSRANLTTSISSEGRWSPAELRSLPFGDFARIMAELMTRMGYENVRLVGRAAGGGRNGTGGYDLHCSVRGGEFGGRRRTVLVLLKQFARNAWVFQRMVDELRGVAVREGADGAILLTTGRLSPVIAQCEDRDANDEGFTLRTMPPVQRFDGIQLCRLLSLYGIGQPRPSVPAEPDPAVAPTPARSKNPQSEWVSETTKASRPVLPAPRQVQSGEVVEVTVKVTYGIDPSSASIPFARSW